MQRVNQNYEKIYKIIIMNQNFHLTSKQTFRYPHFAHRLCHNLNKIPNLGKWLKVLIFKVGERNLGRRAVNLINFWLNYWLYELVFKPVSYKLPPLRNNTVSWWRPLSVLCELFSEILHGQRWVRDLISDKEQTTV